MPNIKHISMIVIEQWEMKGLPHKQPLLLPSGRNSKHVTQAYTAHNCTKYEEFIYDNLWAVTIKCFTQKLPFKPSVGRNYKKHIQIYTPQIYLPHTAMKGLG